MYFVLMGIHFMRVKKLEKKYKFEEKWCLRSKEYSAISSWKEILLEMLSNNDYKSVVWILFLHRGFYINNNMQFIQGFLYEDNLFTLEVF